MFYLIDYFSGEPTIVTHQNGKTMWFETRVDAERFAQENLQDDFDIMVFT